MAERLTWIISIRSPKRTERGSPVVFEQTRDEQSRTEEKVFHLVDFLRLVRVSLIYRC